MPRGRQSALWASFRGADVTAEVNGRAAARIVDSYPPDCAPVPLHADGWAHSIEVWRGDTLVGGAIGIGIGGVFCGDSLFGGHQDAARVAVADMAARLEEAGGLLIDAQRDSPFLRSPGAEPVPREDDLPLLGPG